MQRSSSFTLILSCEREKPLNFYKDLLGVILNYRGNIKNQIVVNSADTGPTRPDERFYNLLLVDSSKSFLKINLASTVQNYNINEYYHIFLQNRDRFLFGDIQQILSYCWSNYIINVNIQVQKSSGEIIVYTYFPYTESHCGKVVPVEINRYYNGTMQNDVLFPQKLHNMFNCPLRIATWNFPPYLTLNFLNGGRIAIGGFEGNLLLQLSKLMNFNIEILVPPNNEARGTILGNHSTGAIDMLRRRNADLSLGCFLYAYSRSQMLTASHPYFQASNVAVLLASSSNYSTVPALWFPFKREASIALLVTFLFNLTLLFGVSRLIFGEENPHSICIKFIASTLGLPSAIEPNRNSGRIFIISWMLFILLVRTNYGAVIYHLIRNNMFRKAPSTIHDIMRLDYKFAVNRGTYSAMLQTTIFSETGLGFVFVDDDQDGAVFTYLEKHPTEKLLTISPLDFLLHYVATNRKYGVMTILKESFMVQNLCIYFTKHSFLVDRVNFLVQQIHAVGLIDYWVKKSFDLSYLKSKRPPKALTIGQRELKGIYYLCGMMMIASLLVFCLEIVSLKFRFLRRVFQKL